MENHLIMVVQVERISITETVTDRSGFVYLAEPFKQWLIRIDSANSGIDGSFIAFSCCLRESLKSEGTKIKFSGHLKKVDKNEIPNPELAATQWFVIDFSKVEKVE